MMRSKVDALTGTQCRMARAGLRLSIDDASKASTVSRASIVRLESGAPVRPSLRLALREALERQGAVFVRNGVKIISSEVA
jgi:DNA-binding XRE family transcriptional regulator